MKSAFKRQTGRHLRLVLKFFVSFGLILWLFTRIDAKLFLSAFYQMPTGTLVGALTVYIAAVAVGALKWHQLIGSVEYRLVFRLMFVAQTYALLLPGQIAGEVVKAYKLNAYRKEPEAVISSIVFDRLTGWGALLSMGLIGIMTSQVGDAAVLLSPFAAALSVLVAVLWIAGLNLPAVGLKKRLRSFPELGQWYTKTLNFVSRTSAACRAYTRKPFLLLQTFILGLAYHLLGAAIFYMFCRGLAIEVEFLDICWVFAAISLLLLLPVAVGGIGLREGGLVMLLGWLSVPAEKALAVSLSFFALQVVGALIGALLEGRPGSPAHMSGPVPAAPCEPVAVKNK
jgi:uncharacterized protein (TIRG00374 family)